MRKSKMSGKTKMIWLLIIIGFMFMEFPGVFFFKDKSDPFILGLPFIYGYILCWWVYFCAILFYAYKVNWGEDITYKANWGDEVKSEGGWEE